LIHVFILLCAGGLLLVVRSEGKPSLFKIYNQIITRHNLLVSRFVTRIFTICLISYQIMSFLQIYVISDILILNQQNTARRVGGRDRITAWNTLVQCIQVVFGVSITIINIAMWISLVSSRKKCSSVVWDVGVFSFFFFVFFGNFSLHHQQQQ